MDPSRAIDLYCERLGPGLGAEPLNFLSNAAFAIAAALGARWLKERDLKSRALWTLVALAYAIAVGSALFHSVATAWAMAADVIPIALYLLIYIGVLARHLLGMSWSATAGAYAGFIALTALGLVGVDRDLVGGSNGYFGAAATLLIAAGLLRRHAAEPARLYGLAGIVFSLSLTLRSIDLRNCAWFPLGTHWAWHLLNGVVIALTLRAAALLAREAKPRLHRAG